MKARVRLANALRRLARRLDPPRFPVRPVLMSEFKFQLRVEVFGRHDFACVDCRKSFTPRTDPYCGEGVPGLTLGHIIPDSMGGLLEPRNLVAQCTECNHLLGARVWTPGWFLAPLADTPPVQIPDDQASRNAWLDDLQTAIAAA